MGRLNFDREQFGKAVEYFERVMPYLNEQEWDKRDPVGYAVLLDEYATSLERAGKSGAVEVLRGRAEVLRKTFPGKSSQTDRTPYGTQCQEAN